MRERLIIQGVVQKNLPWAKSGEALTLQPELLLPGTSVNGPPGASAT